MLRTAEFRLALLAAAFLAAFAAPAWAQSRGGAGRAMAGHLSAGRTAAFSPQIRNSTHFNGAPGLGFDYPHLAAISGAFQSGMHGHFRRSGSFFAPVFFDALPFFEFADDFLNPQPPQPQVIVLQQPSPAIVVAPSIPAQAAVPAPEAEPPSDAAPAAEPSQFVLVHRDGQIQFAVAFVITADRLTYITSEGLRRTFPLADLDKEATRQMNDANGTTLVIPD